MQTGMNSCQECEKKRESILYLLWWYTMEKSMGWTKKTEGYDGGYAKMDGEKLQRLFNEPAGNTVK